MPRYTNSGSVIVPIGKLSFKPGVETVTLKYVNHPDLTLVSDNPRIRPFVTLHSDTISAIPANGVTGMENFKFLTIQNFTGATITITANEDALNTIDIPSNQNVEFGIDNDWRRLDVTGSGTGIFNVYVSNLRRI